MVFHKSGCQNRSRDCVIEGTASLPDNFESRSRRIYIYFFFNPRLARYTVIVTARRVEGALFEGAGSLKAGCQVRRCMCASMDAGSRAFSRAAVGFLRSVLSFRPVAERCFFFVARSVPRRAALSMASYSWPRIPGVPSVTGTRREEEFLGNGRRVAVNEGSDIQRSSGEIRPFPFGTLIRTDSIVPRLLSRAHLRGIPLSSAADSAPRTSGSSRETRAKKARRGKSDVDVDVDVDVVLRRGHKARIMILRLKETA